MILRYLRLHHFIKGSISHTPPPINYKRHYLIGQNFGGQNFRWTKFFGGQYFRHEAWFSALLSAEIICPLIFCQKFYLTIIFFLAYFLRYMSRPSYQKNKDHPFLSNNIIIILTISFYNEKYNYVRIYRSSIFRPDLGVKNMIFGRTWWKKIINTVTQWTIKRCKTTNPITNFLIY